MAIKSRLSIIFAFLIVVSFCFASFQPCESLSDDDKVKTDINMQNKSSVVQVSGEVNNFTKYIRDLISMYKEVCNFLFSYFLFIYLFAFYVAMLG